MAREAWLGKQHGMWDYVKLHERYVRGLLEDPPENPDWEALRAFHEEQTARMHAERVVHLIVTMFCSTFLLMVLGFAILNPSWPPLALSCLFLILVSAYLLHYFRLENGVQRWYHLSNELRFRAGQVGARYEEKRVNPNSS